MLAFSFAGVALAVVYIFGLAPLLDVTYYFLLMACYLPIAFLFLPAHRNEKRVGWLSYAPALLTLGLTLFLAYKSRDLVYQTWVPATHTWQLVVAAALSLVILEAARRSGGYIFLGIVLTLGLYPVFADRMPELIWGPPTTLARTLAFNVYSSDALLGVVTRVVGEVIVGFLIFAALMVATGAADFFLKLAMALMGTARGGPAKVAVLSSGFFGSLSGSIFSNVVSTGAVTIPTMKRAGFPAHYAGALEACASTGGMLMPPVMGAVAFIMADFTNTQYGVIALAALIPSLLYYFGLYCHVDGYAARNGMTGTRQEDLPTVRQTLKEGWPFLTVLAFLVLRYDLALDTLRPLPGVPVTARAACAEMGRSLAADVYRLVEPASPRAAVRILGAWTRQPLLDDQSTTIDMAGDPAVLRLPLRARNFSDPETEDGVRCRWVRDRDARLFLPLATPSALAVSIRARALETIEPQFMELDWNGTTVGRQPMTTAWADYRFDVPAAAARAGTNEMVLRFDRAPLYRRMRGHGPHEARPAAIAAITLARAAAPGPGELR